MTDVHPVLEHAPRAHPHARRVMLQTWAWWTARSALCVFSMLALHGLGQVVGGALHAAVGSDPTHAQGTAGNARRPAPRPPDSSLAQATTHKTLPPPATSSVHTVELTAAQAVVWQTLARTRTSEAAHCALHALSSEMQTGSQNPPTPLIRLFCAGVSTDAALLSVPPVLLNGQALLQSATQATQGIQGIGKSAHGWVESGSGRRSKVFCYDPAADQWAPPTFSGAAAGTGSATTHAKAPPCP